MDYELNKEFKDAKIELSLDVVLDALSGLQYAADVTRSKLIAGSRDQFKNAMQLAIARKAEQSANKNVIPEMTDPLGAHWTQPARENIRIDDLIARMSKSDFDSLAAPTGSEPWSKYLGKMWKAQDRGKWYLLWYRDPGDPNFVFAEKREIILID